MRTRERKGVPGGRQLRRPVAEYPDQLASPWLACPTMPTTPGEDIHIVRDGERRIVVVDLTPPMFD